MKKLLILFLIFTLFLSGCDTSNPAIIKVMGTDGQSHSINISSDGQFIVNTETVFQEISMHGQLEKKSAYNFHIIGRRAGFVNTTTLQDVKEFDSTTSSLFPVDLTGVETLEIVSTSANDTFTGTGAKQVSIYYLDTSNNAANYTVSMNGTSAVTLPFKANFVYSMEVIDIGNNQVSVGNITLRTTGLVIYEQITAGGNKSLSSHFMIPANYTGYLVSWSATSITTSGQPQQQDVRIRATVNEDGTLSNAYHFLDNAFLNSGTASPQFELPYIKLPELTKIKISTLSTATATSTRIDGSYCVFIVHN